MGGRLFVGIDTHKEFHAVCALDERGAVVLEETWPANKAGYEGLCRSLEGIGRPARVAIEGSSSYGRGLSDHMRRRGYDVREAVRPGRRAYSPNGKTDAADALAAARLAFWDQCAGEPKDNGGASEDLAYLTAARESAVKEYRSVGNALQGLVAKAPSDIRDPLAGLKGRALAEAVESAPDAGHPAIFCALRSLAGRWRAAFDEAERLAERMEAIVKARYAPPSWARRGSAWSRPRPWPQSRARIPSASSRRRHSPRAWARARFPRRRERATT